MTVLATNFVLGLFGFYLVSDCIERDIRTGVGQIIATTPVRRATYLVGKWLSNLAVLSVLELILAAAAVIMVLLKRESGAGPGRAADAVSRRRAALHGANRRARGGVRDCALVARGGGQRGLLFPGGDVYACVIADREHGSTCFSETRRASTSFAHPYLQRPARPFPAKRWADKHPVRPRSPIQGLHWPGLAWTPGIVAGHWLWAVVGLGLILLSAVWFARFDPSQEGLRRAQVKPEEAKEGEPTEPRKKVPAFRAASRCPTFRRSLQNWPSRIPSWGFCLPSCACCSTAAAGGGGSSSPG